MLINDFVKLRALVDEICLITELPVLAGKLGGFLDSANSWLASVKECDDGKYSKEFMALEGGANLIAHLAAKTTPYTETLVIAPEDGGCLLRLFRELRASGEAGKAGGYLMLWFKEEDGVYELTQYGKEIIKSLSRCSIVPSVENLASVRLSAQQREFAVQFDIALSLLRESADGGSDALEMSLKTREARDLRRQSTRYLASLLDLSDEAVEPMMDRIAEELVWDQDVRWRHEKSWCPEFWYQPPIDPAAIIDPLGRALAVSTALQVINSHARVFSRREAIERVARQIEEEDQDGDC